MLKDSKSKCHFLQCKAIFIHLQALEAKAIDLKDKWARILCKRMKLGNKIGCLAYQCLVAKKTHKQEFIPQFKACIADNYIKVCFLNAQYLCVCWKLWRCKYKHTKYNLQLSPPHQFIYC